MGSHTKQYSIPWAAWHEETLSGSSRLGASEMSVSFPESWDIGMVNINSAPKVDSESINIAVENPIGVPSLAEIISGKNRRIAIAVDDLTRPACIEPVIEILLKTLQVSGIENEQIQIIVAVAAHKPLTRNDIIKKVGKTAGKALKVVSHNAESDLHEIQLGEGKTVPINRKFVNADVKIVIGSVMPHFYAGYSGGAKIILPGLAGLQAILNTHKSVLMGLSGKLRQIDGNRFRTRIESIAKAVGVDFAIQLVVGRNREIVGVFAGDIISAHRAAARFAEKVYVTEFPKNLDIAILNAYPKDTELLQAENAFIAYRSSRDLVKPDGTIILTSACSEGFGVHGLFQPGCPLYREPRPHSFLEGRHMIVFAPGVNKHEFHSAFSRDYSFHRHWQGVIDELTQRYSGPCRVGIIPCAALQMSKDVLSG